MAVLDVSTKRIQNLPTRESRGGFPSGGGLGGTPSFFFIPLSLGKGEGDTGGEGFEDGFNEEPDAARRR